jgi:hypothetical protein
MILEWAYADQLKYSRVKIRIQQRRVEKYRLSNLLRDESWLAILTTFGERCAYCGRSADAIGAPLTLDHFVPISDCASMGNVAWNVIPACGPCNWNKDGKDPFIWLEQRFGREQGRGIARRILTYLAEARYWYYADKKERRYKRRKAVQS